MPNELAAPLTLPPAFRRPGRPSKPSQKLRGITKRTAQALELMVFGAADGPQAGIALPRPEAAKAVGISDSALYRALRNPAARQRLQELQQVLRDSLRPRALARIGALIDVADRDQVRLDAAKWIDSDGQVGKGASVHTNVQVNIAPGYLVRIPAEYAGEQQTPHLVQIEAKPLK